MPTAAQLLEFYRHHDGGVLFQDPDSKSAGLELLSQSSWVLLTAAILEAYQALGPEDEPGWLGCFVAFAEVPHSGNFIVLSLDGPHQGKVIYCDHEGPGKVLAADFETFIAQIIKDPAALLDRLGGFLHFNRGREQWIPELYISG